VAEWIHYADWLVKAGYSLNGHHGWRSKIGLTLKQRAMRKAEKEIKQRLARSGLIHPDIVDIPAIIRHARPHLAPDHLGEAILTIGTALKEVVDNTCGVISIGPFGCMPNRIAESILGEIMTAADKLNSAPGDHRLRPVLDGVTTLPFLSIESDGAPFPQIITAKMEAFLLQARRLHDRRHRHAVN
jgi:predicted nucleotide-binding protein (sugar kinase/HSP70/actin superfamily)